MKSSPFKFSLCAVALASLAACGGGGDAGTPTAASPAPTSPAPAAAAPISVKLTALNVKRGEALATTASTTTKVSALFNFFKSTAFDAMGVIAPSAMASTLPQLRVGDGTTGFTNKLKDGYIVSLGAQIKPKDGSTTIPCDVTNVDLKVNTLWNIDAAKGHMLANLTVPDTVDPKDCTVRYRTVDFVITGTGAAIELSKTDAGTAGVYDILQAGDEAYNTSGKPLLVYNDGIIRTLEIDEVAGTIKTTDLNAVTLPFFKGLGMYAYDGRFFVGRPTDRQDALLVFDSQTKAVKLVSLAADDKLHVGVHDGVILDADGNFNWVIWGGFFRKVDPLTGTYEAPQAVRTAPCLTDSTGATITTPDTSGVVNNIKDSLGFNCTPGTANIRPGAVGYGLAGRLGTTFLSKQAMLWDYKTNTSKYLPNFPTFGYKATDAALPVNYARVAGGKAYVVSGVSSNIVVRYDSKSDKAVGFDTDKLGYLVKKTCTSANNANGSCVNVFETHALVEVVDLSTADRKYVELNFESGQVIDRGVITSGDRKVVSLVIPGN